MGKFHEGRVLFPHGRRRRPRIENGNAKLGMTIVVVKQLVSIGKCGLA